ncbi:sulfotransferase family 2 domain-containing protein [Amphritea balenae]|nr:sulfotransferase family 2 domain-containing protein [Amphritea balenae]GGK74795.1 hypothetical protein GCM10007941_26060 [Amphritea balenae]
MMKNIFFSRHYGLCFISNPKVACSTIKHSLLDGCYEGNVHDSASFELPKDSDTPLFALTRNPFSRALSGYKNKVGPNQDDNVWVPFCEKYKLDSNKGISFLDFLKVLSSDKNVSEIDEHFRPQYLNLHRDHIKPEFIGRIERMVDVVSFLSEYGVSFETQSAHKTNASLIYKDIITEEEAELIVNIYSADFEEYGYSKDVKSDFIPESIRQTQETSIYYKAFAITNLFDLSVDELRSLAISKESGNSEASFNLMYQAFLKRPHGPLINKKMSRFSKLNPEWKKLYDIENE